MGGNSKGKMAKIFFSDKNGNKVQVGEMPKIKVAKIIGNQRQARQLDNMRNARIAQTQGRAKQLLDDIFDKPVNQDDTYKYFGLNDEQTTIISKRPEEQKAILQYAAAINKRDRDAVLAVDKKVKNGDFGTGKDIEKVSNFRKMLLELSKDSPKKVAEIYKETVRKYRKTATPNEKLYDFQKKFIGKKIRLKNDVGAGYFGSESKYNLYYPKGTEGTVLKVKGITHTLPDPDRDFAPTKVASYDFLMDLGNGFKKWFSSSDIEPAF